MSNKKKLIIIDVSNFIFRAFFAVRPLHAPDGTPVNAVHGVLSMFLKILSQYRPTHIFLARDTAGGSFRNEMYDQYKANRSEPPEELVPQFGLIKELIEQLEFKNVGLEIYEADDVIGSAVTQWRDYFDELYIASGDKDLMQFVDDKVKMIDTMKDVIYDAKAVFEKMGVRPDQIVDYLSIIGDTSDNIPGMRGVGPKGASALLAEYGTLEKCIENKDKFTGKKLVTAFSEHLDDALLSKKLVQIVTDIDLGLTPEDTKLNFYPSDKLITFLKSLGFNSMIKRLEEIKYQISVIEGQESEQNISPSINSNFTHEAITTIEEAIKILEGNKIVAVQSEFDSEDIYLRNIIGLSFSVDGKISYFLRINESDLQKLFPHLWGNPEVEIYTEHSKREYSVFLRLRLVVEAQIFDIIQAHFVADAGSSHAIENIAKSIGIELAKLEDKERFITNFDDKTIAVYSGQRAIAAYLIGDYLKTELKEKELLQVYNTIDSKLTPVLAAMELEGIRLNKEYLKELEGELEENLNAIQKKIDSYCKSPINLNSPKQVGELLFNELAFPVAKKTKTGFSTDSSVLEELSALNINEVPDLILQFRELGKIQSTYVKALPELVNTTTGKIHTNFNAHVAQTGRLSSVNPNLQNIPIRSATGRKVRKAFIASPGKLLLSADYSQVELRILAHYSKDPTMLKAFSEDKDIHAQTASEITGHPLDKVTADERSKAKAVNFGLMYGQSSFGLAAALKISRKEAKEYIEKYFERFSTIKGLLDTLKEDAEKTGYSVTLYGRKRYLPDIHSNNRTIKSNAERMAINSPIQGTASDIIKCAMINIAHQLKTENMKSKMLLQVHDELIFEVYEEELTKMKQIVKEGMEGVIKLDVPLKVDMGIGVNWYDLK